MSLMRYHRALTPLLFGMEANSETVWVWVPGFGWVERPAHPEPDEFVTAA